MYVRVYVCVRVCGERRKRARETEESERERKRETCVRESCEYREVTSSMKMLICGSLHLFAYLTLFSSPLSCGLIPDKRTREQEREREREREREKRGERERREREREKISKVIILFTSQVQKPRQANSLCDAG